MSSGNKLSISICDDNGNLSYQKQYSVRRIIQRGVMSKDSGIITIGANELGYEYDDDAEKWIPVNTTGKFVFIAEYNAGFPNETVLGFGVDTTFAGENTVYHDILFAFANLDGWNGFCGTVWSESQEPDMKDFCLKMMTKKEGGGIWFQDWEEIIDTTLPSITVYTSDDGDAFQCCETKTMKGKRWFLLQPLKLMNLNAVSPEYSPAIMIGYENKTRKCGIKYFIVEVEE